MLEIAARKRTLPAPPHVVWETLTNPHRPGSRPWLDLHDGETEPAILAAEKPDRVIWSSLWPDRPDDQVHVELSWAGAETLLAWRLMTPADPPDDDSARQLRKRLDHLFFADLRFSFGQ